ncbi:MAG: SPOR domain-containing protein [Betaproteobacteria bacterium]|nr:MAG: SPOR domain-containing protein [Betaproteobacteria bacterium]
MRALFLLLIAANLGFYAWTQQLDPREQGLDPEPMARQIEPEKLKILSPAELLARSSAGRRGACAEWGGFTAAEAARAEQALAPLALGARLAQRRSEETAHWWVFLPPQGSRQGAQRKLDELKALGVEEYFVMQEEGRLRWAISLGVFRTQESARVRLDALTAKKVRGAQIGERDTQVTKLWFQVLDADEALLARLKALAQEFPASEVRECAASG